MNRIEKTLLFAPAIIGAFTQNPVMLALSTAVRGCFIFCPTLINRLIEPKERLSKEEQKKADKIESVIEEVKTELGLNHLVVNAHFEKENFSGAAISGSTLSFGGVDLMISKDYLNTFDQKQIENSYSYQEWLSIFNFLPSDPTGLARTLDQMSVGELNYIKYYLSKYLSVIQKSELKGVIAHEFGHATGLDFLRSLGFLKVAFLLIEYSYYELIPPIFYLPIIYYGFLKWQRVKEVEADLYATSVKEHQEGLKIYFKKYALVTLLNLKNKHPNCSFSQLVKEELNQFDYNRTRPNCVRRLENLNSPNFKANKSSYLYTLSKSVALVGLTSFGYDVIDRIQSLREYLPLF